MGVVRSSKRLLVHDLHTPSLTLLLKGGGDLSEVEHGEILRTGLPAQPFDMNHRGSQ